MGVLPISDIGNVIESSFQVVQEGSGFDMPFGRGGMMLPGAPMMPPEFMMAAMGGMPGGGLLPPPPRPPPGPPPGLPPSGNERGGRTPDFSPERQQRAFRFDITRTPTRFATDVPYLDRVKATCALMGVGAMKPEQASADAVEAAIAALQSGEAFESNVYADAVDVHGH